MCGGKSKNVLPTKLLGFSRTVGYGVQARSAFLSFLVCGKRIDGCSSSKKITRLKYQINLTLLMTSMEKQC